MDQKLTGEVKMFNADKGYGFIKASDGKEYFFHFSVIQGNGQQDPQPGDKVELEVGQGDRGPKATVVVMVDGDSASSEGEENEEDGGAVLEI